MADDNTPSDPSGGGNGPRTPRSPKSTRGTRTRTARGPDPERVAKLAKAFDKLVTKWDTVADKGNEFTKVIKGQTSALNNLFKTMNEKMDQSNKRRISANESLIQTFRQSNSYLQTQIGMVNKLTVAINNMNKATAGGGGFRGGSGGSGGGGGGRRRGVGVGAMGPIDRFIYNAQPKEPGQAMAENIDESMRNRPRWDEQMNNIVQKQMNDKPMLPEGSDFEGVAENMNRMKRATVDSGAAFDQWIKKVEKANKDAAILKKAEEALAKEQAKQARDKSWIGTMDRLSKKLRETGRDMRQFQRRNIFGKAGILFSPDEKQSKMGAGLVIAGSAIAGTWGMVGEVLGLVKKIFFATWDYIDTYVLPTNALLNKSLGATTFGMRDLRKQAMSTGNQFRALGMDFAEGTQLVNDLAQGLYTAKIPDKNLQSMIKLSSYVGLGAAQTAKLENVFSSLGGSFSELDTAMRGTPGDMEKQFGVASQGVRKELGESTEDLIRFGRTNVMSLKKSIAMAHQYGVSWKDIGRDFGKTFDTFENASDAAAKLNEAFGTQLDSVSLMMEKDQGKRMMMIRKQLEMQGVSYEKLGFQAQNLIENTLGIDKANAALYFGSEKNRKEAEKRAKQARNEAKFDDDWAKGIRNLQRNLWNVTMDVEKFLFALGKVVAKFFGKKDGFEGTVDIVKFLKAELNGLTDKINKWADEGGVEKIKQFFKDMLGFFYKMNDALDKVTNSKVFDLFFGKPTTRAVMPANPATSMMSTLANSSFMAGMGMNPMLGPVPYELAPATAADSNDSPMDRRQSSKGTANPLQSSANATDQYSIVFNNYGYMDKSAFLRALNEGLVRQAGRGGIH